MSVLKMTRSRWENKFQGQREKFLSFLCSRNFFWACLLKSISYGGIVLILCVWRERKPPIYVNFWRLWIHRRARKECSENWGNRQSNSANANDKMNSREYLLAMAWHEHSIVVPRFLHFAWLSSGDVTR